MTSTEAVVPQYPIEVEVRMGDHTMEDVSPKAIRQELKAFLAPLLAVARQAATFWFWVGPVTKGGNRDDPLKVQGPRLNSVQLRLVLDKITIIGWLSRPRNLTAGEFYERLCEANGQMEDERENLELPLPLDVGESQAFGIDLRLIADFINRWQSTGEKKEFLPAETLLFLFLHLRKKPRLDGNLSFTRSNYMQKLGFGQLRQGADEVLKVLERGLTGQGPVYLKSECQGGEWRYRFTSKAVELIEELLLKESGREGEDLGSQLSDDLAAVRAAEVSRVVGPRQSPYAQAEAFIASLASIEELELVEQRRETLARQEALLAEEITADAQEVNQLRLLLNQKKERWRGIQRELSDPELGKTIKVLEAIRELKALEGEEKVKA